MAKVITPSTGVNLTAIYTTGAQDFLNGGLPVPLGTRVVGDDGHDYVFVKASAAIAASTAIVVTEPAFTAAAGAGSWTTVAGQAPAITNTFWAKRVAI